MLEDRFPQIMNQLKVLALNEGLGCKKQQRREAGREQLESFGLGVGQSTPAGSAGVAGSTYSAAHNPSQ
jgi:hypothetical protein